MKKLKLRVCSVAERDHKKSRRQYAHVLHVDGTICVCRAFDDLPRSHQYAILLHELGHVASPDEEDELAIDRLASKLFGILITRRSTHWGENLEWIELRDTPRAEAVLRKHVALPRGRHALAYKNPPRIDLVRQRDGTPTRSSSVQGSRV